MMNTVLKLTFSVFLFLCFITKNMQQLMLLNCAYFIFYLYFIYILFIIILTNYVFIVYTPSKTPAIAK